MSKSVFVATAVLLAATVTVAFAEDAKGTVASVDKAGNTITLSDGEVFSVPADIWIQTIKVGDNVSIRYAPTVYGTSQIKSLRHLK